jgi:hypothetical protein
MDRIVYVCPSCSGELEATQLECSHCGVKLTGQFRGCPFCRLSDEELDFALTFLRCRGNIRDVERVLGISYPTVRSRLESLRKRLGLEAEESPAQVIALLEKGEISVDEAVKLIKRRKDERR